MAGGCDNDLMMKKLILFAALMVGKILKLSIDSALGATDIYTTQPRTIHKEEND